MSKSEIKFNAARATAVAAVNATVQHMFLGLFMSEFTCDKWYMEYTEKRGNAIQCSIKGRTDKGTRVEASCTLVLGSSDSETYEFPFSKIYVTIDDPEVEYEPGERESSMFLWDENLYFEFCRYRENLEWKFMLVQLEDCQY